MILRAAILALALATGPVLAQEFELGYEAYQRGEYDGALVYWTPLAAHGHAGAQHNLGLMYKVGQGVGIDLATAFYWFELAAEQGNALAQSNLGSAYYKGLGTPLDAELAVYWFRLSAEQGVAISQYNLGRAYLFGSGVAKDVDAAALWYSRAATQGLSEAQNSLGVLYKDGDGVRQDNLRAYMWFSVAGGFRAWRNRLYVRRDMRPDDITRADEMAQRCEASGFRDCG